MQATALGALLAILTISCAAWSETSEDDVLLALPWKQFDQTLESGWRVYAMRDEHLPAARLIERYLAERSDLTPVERAVSHFHAGAELARVNLHKEALAHFDQATVPAGGKGVPEDWNELVTANKAFLLGDRAALLACKQRDALACFSRHVCIAARVPGAALGSLGRRAETLVPKANNVTCVHERNA
jgi:hypothetical protein